jgi:hypothetical protein
MLVAFAVAFSKRVDLALVTSMLVHSLWSRSMIDCQVCSLGNSPFIYQKALQYSRHCAANMNNGNSWVIQGANDCFPERVSAPMRASFPRKLSSLVCRDLLMTLFSLPLTYLASSILLILGMPCTNALAWPIEEEEDGLPGSMRSILMTTTTRLLFVVTHGGSNRRRTVSSPLLKRLPAPKQYVAVVRTLRQWWRSDGVTED